MGLLAQMVLCFHAASLLVLEWPLILSCWHKPEWDSSVGDVGKVSRAQQICIIMGPLDMRGLVGAATIMGCLKYGACFSGLDAQDDLVLLLRLKDEDLLDQWNGGQPQQKAGLMWSWMLEKKVDLVSDNSSTNSECTVLEASSVASDQDRFDTAYEAFRDLSAELYDIDTTRVSPAKMRLVSCWLMGRRSCAN